MSLAEPESLQDRRPSAKLALNLASNNPFRQRATSPSKAPSSLPAQTAANAPRPKPPQPSTNPFLDNYHPPTDFFATTTENSPPPAPAPAQYEPPTRQPPPANPESTAELLNGLVLTEQPLSDRNIQQPPPPPRLLESNTNPSVSNHRSTRSQDENKRSHRDPRGAPMNDPAVSSRRSPMKRMERKAIARRNSETSVIDVQDAERKSRTRTEMDKEARSKDPKHRGHRRPHKSSKRVDLIDKLDVTGLYGTGMFHHDGPFDACNPHRNRRGARAAPMGAFAEGSANNSIGGSGPINKQIDLDTFHGRGSDAFQDYNKYAQGADAYPGYRRGPHDPNGRRPPPPAFVDSNIDDPKARTQVVFGNETAGLGSSTFLEGTPVSRSAMQRKENEYDVNATGGLQRKKSLAQKIRGGMSRQRTVDANGNVVSPEPRYLDPITGKVISPGSPQFVQSAGGTARLNEVNPFFSDVDPVSDVVEQEKKTEVITQTKVPDPDQEAFVAVTRARTASSPRRNRFRSPSNENGSNDPFEGKPPSGGFLNRVKSLKGGRRTRPDRSGSASQAV